jgi:transposase
VQHEGITAALGLQHWFVEAVAETPGGELRLRLDRRLPQHTCSRCGTKTIRRYDHEVRQLRDLSISGRVVYLLVPQWRVPCPQCQAVVTEELDLCDPGQVLTKRYERRIAELCEFLSLQAVAELEGLSWSTVVRIDRKYLKLRKQAYEIGEVRKLCIDEVAYRKGQRYVTVVSDLQTRRVVWVGKGREKATVAAFFQALGPQRTARIECFAMDMSAAYIAAVEEGAPQAFIIYDHFHIMKYVNEAVDQVRRDEQARADRAGKEALKNKRFVLLRRERDLPMKQRISLWELYTLNERIAISHILKEDFFTLFECKSIEQAARFLDAWTARARESKLAPFARLCEQLDRWRDGLLNYFIHRISNGLAEAINNNINVLKRVARGFRDLDYFILKIHQRCGSLPPLWQVLPPGPNALTHTL